MAAAASVTARFAGVCSVSGRGDAPAGAGASKTARGVVHTRARCGKSSRMMMNGGIGANLRARNDDRASHSTVVAAVMESGSPATSTYQRRPEDVVASNGREVEQFATEACVARQNSGLLVPPPRIPPAMLDEAYERCDEVTGEYAKTFYLGTKLMTQEKQRAIWAIYVWCRRTDEIVDAPRGPDDPDMLTDLSAWEIRTEELWRTGEIKDALDLPLLDVRLNYPKLDIAPFLDMVRGMLMDIPDLGQDRYETFDELHLYCYRVAGTVGLMTMPVFGCAPGYTEKEAK